MHVEMREMLRREGNTVRETPENREEAENLRHPRPHRGTDAQSGGRRERPLRRSGRQSGGGEAVPRPSRPLRHTATPRPYPGDLRTPQPKV